MREIALAGLILVAAVTLASAAEVPDAWTHRKARGHHCSPDVHRYCPGVTNDGAKLECLRQHQRELSPACSAALARLGVLESR